MTLTDLVARSIRRQGLLPSGSRLLLALSGGPDSVALLLLLRELSQPFSFRLEAAHANHGLRAGAGQDEAFVRELCRRLEIPLEVRCLETRSAARRNRENLEACARRLRYRFLFETAARRHSIVLTAHTLDDQAETFLLKMARGSGPGGLAGIHPRRWNRPAGGGDPVLVVRPLLGVSRRQILSFLDKRGQEYRSDPSNRDLKLDRNWVRHRLIPQIEEHLNPSLMRTLERSAALFREVEEYLRRQSREALERCRTPGEDLGLRLDALAREAPIVQKEVIRRALESCRGSLEGITMRHVRDILGLSESGSGRQVDLPRGLRVVREFDQITFISRPPVGDFCQPVSCPGEVYLPEVGKRLCLVSCASQGPNGEGPLLLPRRLKVRNWRPGDRCRLGSRLWKLKELFQRRRVPRTRRQRLLLLEAWGRVVWVEGFGPDPSCLAAREDPRGVHVVVRSETLSGPGLLRD